MKYSFIFLKPDVSQDIKKVENIFSHLRDNGLTDIRSKKFSFNQNKTLLYEHYAHVKDEEFFPEIEEFMLSGFILPVILKGENACELVCQLVGHKDPEIADNGTLRKVHGTDITRNAVHRADSPESVLEEISRFFPEENELLAEIQREMDALL